MEYRAIYSGESISHGKFKYIDKWKSKTGKWVYKYADSKKKGLSNFAENALGQLSFNLHGLGSNNSGGTHINANPHYNSSRPSKVKKKRNSSNRGSASSWHNSSAADTLRGDDKTRIRTFKNANGQTVRRQEYKNTSENANLKRSVRKTNDAYKSYYGPIGAAIMTLNDKYGPKRIETLEGVDLATGRTYVEERTVNVLGFGRTTDVEVYTYDPERVMRKKKLNSSKRRAGKKRSAEKKVHQKYTRR